MCYCAVRIGTGLKYKQVLIKVNECKSNDLVNSNRVSSIQHIQNQN